MMVIIWIESFEERIDTTNMEIVNQIDKWYMNWKHKLSSLYQCELFEHERYGAVIFTTNSSLEETERIVEKQLKEWVAAANNDLRGYDII